MKSTVLGLALTVMLAGCSGRLENTQHAREEAAISPKKVGTQYHFKVWPGDDTTYSLTLNGVTGTSAQLGPDFSVQYFQFETGSAMSIYNGWHPQTSDEKREGVFKSLIGRQPATWRLNHHEGTYRAEAQVPAEESDGLWSIVIYGPTKERVKEIAKELSTLN